MKKTAVSILKILLPFALAILLIWWYARKITPEDWDDILNAFRTADYSWILLSITIAFFSHLSRAYRWKYTQEPLGFKPRFWNNYHAVMIGYLINLGVPRAGELARCGFLARYEKLPFEKLLGTVIGERVADLIILSSLTVTVILLQLNILREHLKTLLGPLGEKLTSAWFLALVAGVGAVVFFVLYRYIKRSTSEWAIKVRSFLNGLGEGIKSILHMRHKWYFLGHTLFIWGMYVLMFYVCFFSLPNVSSVPIPGILAGFVLGGLTIVALPGGLGAYPLAVMGILALYGIAESEGYAFGWIVWGAQTLLLAGLGFISLQVMPLVNKNYVPHGPLAPTTSE